MKVFILLVFVLMTSCTKSPAPTSEPYDHIKYLQERIQHAPSFENYSNLGLEYSMRKNTAEALKAFKMALQINSNAPLAWNNVCAELNTQGKFSEALPHCEKAVELEPKFNLAKNNLEFARSKLKR
jgi:protein O-mannosyl-transferase